MDKVADKLEINVSEEEINGHIAQLAIQRKQRPERMREEMARNGSLAQFRLEVRQNKFIAKLLETAKITEKKPEKKTKKIRKTRKLQALIVNVRNAASRVIALSPNVPEEASILLDNIADP